MCCDTVMFVCVICIYICKCVTWYGVGCLYIWCDGVLGVVGCVYGVCGVCRELDVACFLCVHVWCVLDEVSVSWCRWYLGDVSTEIWTQGVGGMNGISLCQALLCGPQAWHVYVCPTCGAGCLG